MHYVIMEMKFGDSRLDRMLQQNNVTFCKKIDKHVLFASISLVTFSNLANVYRVSLLCTYYIQQIRQPYREICISYKSFAYQNSGTKEM